jgi:fatty acid desaturase
MSRLRKIALIGIGAAAVLTGLAVWFGFPPAVAGVHALPFCMLLIIDISRKKSPDTKRPDRQL